MNKHFELPKEFATKWLEDLRSGEYEQARHHLYIDGAYCCLGVACVQFLKGRNIEELLVKATYNTVSEPLELFPTIEEDFPKSIYTINPSISELNLGAVLSKFNDGIDRLSLGELLIRYPNIYFNCVEYDENGKITYTFEEIADFIEINVELV
jgi:hypothetical protein